MKKIILLGGGHAHVAVLKSLSEQALAGCEVELVTPFPRQIYSGMLPGWIAGHYRLDECVIDLASLAARAAVKLRITEAEALDFSTATLHCADSSSARFDCLSIDTGSVANTDAIPGAAQYALPIRPIENFVAAWPDVEARIAAATQRFQLVIVGAGAAGTELALAIAHRASTNAWKKLSISLLGTSDLPLDGMPLLARQMMSRQLERKGIAWLAQTRVARIDEGRALLESGQVIGFDGCLLVTGSSAPGWPTASGLAVDELRYVRVGPTLQSLSHPQVFAAGDVAAYHEQRPKSGVFAVRAGPLLADNLRAWCEGRALKSWSPQQRALYLLSTGGREAIATWGRWSWSGAWVWRWKDRIDRRFVRSFAPSPSPDDDR